MSLPVSPWRIALAVLFVLPARLIGAPVIERLIHNTTPTNHQPVLIAVAVDPGSSVISNVTVHYTANDWLAAASVAATQSAGKVYTAALPGQPASTTVRYTASASALDGSSCAAPITNSFVARTPVGGTAIVCRIMAANTTSGTQQAYEGPGIRIFQGLKPDIVAINEFNYKSGTIRQFVDTAFGADFHYYRGGGGSIPNGVISRWPIKASGDWKSPVAERDFSWATIALPGGRNLHVVSVHLPTSSAGNRDSEAYIIKTNVLASFPATDYIVVAGDLNTATRTEAAISTFNSFLANTHTPVDQANNGDTNASRAKPYDWVMPNAVLAARLIATEVQGHSFANGLVYDSRVSAPYQLLPPPVQAGDSGASGMQHMGVCKDFRIVHDGVLRTAPVIGGATHCDVIIGQELLLQIVAADAPTQHLALTCSEPARFSAAPAMGAVTGTFAWTPDLGDFGDHAVAFTASADGLEAHAMINIHVLSEPICAGGLCAALWCMWQCRRRGSQRCV
jgi:endonuclease/exonuclease/phosphatase family metal-dependent hydrolase